MTGRRPTPERITAALDLAGLHGPEADATLGVAEPTVDLWEAGARVPTGDQLALLGELAGVTVEWFYLPAPDPFVGFVCRRSGPGRGCEFVDERASAPVEPLWGQGSLF